MAFEEADAEITRLVRCQRRASLHATAVGTADDVTGAGAAGVHAVLLGSSPFAARHKAARSKGDVRRKGVLRDGYEAGTDASAAAAAVGAAVIRHRSFFSSIGPFDHSRDTSLEIGGQ